MLGLCPQIECGRPRSLPAATKNQKSAGTLSWSRTVGRNSETYCATRVGDGEGGIRFAIPPYELKLSFANGSHSAASLAPLFLGFPAFASTGPKNFPV